MKKILLFSFIIAGGFAAKAQELAPDQNPNYKLSETKYAAQRETLQSTMNTTVQDTYKAYDWRTAKTERRAERREYNRQYNGFNNYNNGYYNPYYYNNGNSYYYSPYSSPYQYRYNYGPRRHW